jgi:hypothetical protein
LNQNTQEQFAPIVDYQSCGAIVYDREHAKGIRRNVEFNDDFHFQASSEELDDWLSNLGFYQVCEEYYSSFFIS